MRTVLYVTILVFILAGMVLGALLLYSPGKTALTDAQKQAALIKLLGREPILSQAIRNSGVIQYDGKHLTFSYPAVAQNYPSNTVNNSTFVLENKEFKESNPRYHFIVQVVQYPNAMTYGAIPSIHLRRTQTNIYTESPMAIDKNQGIAFVSQTDGYEKDAFLLYNGLLYTFVITGGDPEIEKIFDGVVRSASIK